eukprot:745460-Pleurochrysis_carterae.AAC.1
MHKSADVERRAEPRTARRCACAQGACTNVPTSGGGLSYARSTLCLHLRRHRPPLPPRSLTPCAHASARAVVLASGGARAVSLAPPMLRVLYAPAPSSSVAAAAAAHVLHTRQCRCPRTRQRARLRHLAGGVSAARTARASAPATPWRSATAADKRAPRTRQFTRRRTR